MIGLALAAALATAPMTSPPVQSTQPAMTATRAAPSTVSGWTEPAPAAHRRRHVHKPVPQPPLWLGCGLALLLAIVVHLVRRPRAQVRPLAVLDRAFVLTLRMWRHAPIPLLLFSASQAAMAMSKPPALLGGWLLWLILFAIGLVGIYLIPGTVCRYAYREIEPTEPNFQPGPLGVRFGATEKRAFGAWLVLIGGVLLAMLAAYLIGGGLTPLVDGLFARAQAQPALHDLLADLRAPVRREIDFGLMSLLTQIGAARLATYAPRAAAGLPKSLRACWRETRDSWAPIALLLAVQSIAWWVATDLGAPVEATLRHAQQPVLIWVWIALGGVLYASYFVISTAVSAQVFLQLADLRAERRDAAMAQAATTAPT